MAPVAFIRELNKQVRVGLVPCGEGQSAIPGRAFALRRVVSSYQGKRLFTVGPMSKYSFAVPL